MSAAVASEQDAAVHCRRALVVGDFEFEVHPVHLKPFLK